MKNDRLTKMRIASFEVSKVAGDWGETTQRWHRTSDACRGVANLFWQVWVAWHYQHGSYDALKLWLDKRAEVGNKAAGKCPVVCYPKEVSNATYKAASHRYPELAKGEIVLILNRLSSGLKSRKAAKGVLPGWSAILLHHEAHPSFTGSFPILFDRGNTATKIIPPEKPKGNWFVELRVSRREENGKGSTHLDRLELWCQGMKVQSQVAILRQIAVRESNKGSQLQYSRARRKWFVKLCYEMPMGAAEKQDPDRQAVLEAMEDRPWKLTLPDHERTPGGYGRYIGPVRRKLLLQRWHRRENYRQAGHANKGHGRERAGAGPQWKLQQCWKNFVKRVNSNVATEILKICQANGCGTLVYRQPAGEYRDTRFLATSGKVEGRQDSTGWDWFQVRTMLEQRCDEYGVTVIVEKCEGSDGEKTPDSSPMNGQRIQAATARRNRPATARERRSRNDSPRRAKPKIRRPKGLGAGPSQEVNERSENPSG